MQAAKITGTLNITLPIGENGNGAIYTAAAVQSAVDRMDSGLPILSRADTNEPIVIGNTTSRPYGVVFGTDCIGFSVDVSIYAGGTEDQITNRDEDSRIKNMFIQALGFCPFGE